jgi:hypothetical protein
MRHLLSVAIMESRMSVDKRPNTVQELIRRENAMLGYITRGATRTQN